MPRTPSLRLYVITSAGLVPGRDHRHVAEAAIRGRADAVQLRAPELPDEPLRKVAREVAAACAEAGVLFIVNDRVDVAVAAGAAGAHVGQGDDPERARARLGDGGILGVSVATPAQARAARAAGADYVGVTVWQTDTKPEAEPVGVEGLRAVAESTDLPVVAIGGIHAGNATRALAAGAAGVAVISAVGAAPDPEAATRRLVETVRSFRRGPMPAAREEEES